MQEGGGELREVGNEPYGHLGAAVQAEGKEHLPVALVILAVWAGQCRFISPGCYAEEKKGAGEVRQLWPAISL